MEKDDGQNGLSSWKGAPSEHSEMGPVRWMEGGVTQTRRGNGSSRRSWKVRCLYIQNNTVCTSLGSNFFLVFKKVHSSVLFVTYLNLILYGIELKLSCFFSFNRNDNEACDDEDHESDQSVDDADLNFDEVY